MHTTITAVSPAGTGLADVTVITAGGTSATNPADQFTYVAPPPTVTSVAAIRLPHAAHVVCPDFRQSSRPRAGRRSGQLSSGEPGEPSPNHPPPLGDL